MKKRNTEYEEAPFTKSDGKTMEKYTEGQRYLEYKSISGMDLVPRIRQPTPEKKNPLQFTPRDWDGCNKYQAKMKEIIEENLMLKQELEKVHSQMQMLRVT